MQIHEIVFQRKENGNWEKGIQFDNIDNDDEVITKGAEITSTSYCLKGEDLIPMNNNDIFKIQRL